MSEVASISLRQKARPGAITLNAKFRSPMRDWRDLNVTFLLGITSCTADWIRVIFFYKEFHYHFLSIKLDALENNVSGRGGGVFSSAIGTPMSSQIARK
jgi:hypothetical protein